MPNELQEYQRLTALYQELGDAELIQLGKEVGDLTVTAQEVLRSVLSIRGLKVQAAGTLEIPAEAAFGSTDLGPFGYLSSSDCVFEFAEVEDAQAAGEMFMAAGMECHVILPGALDMGVPRVAVLPGDAAEARKLLSQPIPEGFRVLVRTRNQFTPPVCPKCGAVDPLLASTEPVNEWRCEVCGKTWQDSLPF